MLEQGKTSVDNLPEATKQKMEIIPPQYKGLNSEALDEIWTIPEYVDVEKTNSEKQRKERALLFLKEQEQLAENSRGDLEQIKTVQEVSDAEKLSEVRKKLDLENEPMAEPANVGICKQLLEAKMLSGSGNNADFYKQTISEMLTTRSEFAVMKAGVGGDLVELGKKFKKQMQEYKEELMPKIGREVEQQGMKWESNPGWMGVNTRPEMINTEGINYKAYVTVPMNEYYFVKHVPVLAQRLRELAIETDDKIQVKVPNGFMGFMSQNDSLVVHCKKQENASASLEIARSWMQEFDIHEAPREMGRTQIAADSKSESFTQMVSSNIGQWLADNEGKYDQAVLVDEAIKHAIKYSQKPPNIIEK